MFRRFAELYHYRELIRNLVARDLKVRYKNSMLGVLWSLLNPLLMTLVFTVVFGLMIPNNIEDFPVFFMCGFLSWSFFTSSVTGATSSIVSNSTLIKKVYFPREILPLSQVLANLVNYMLALLVLFAMMAVFGFPFKPALLMLPFTILVQVMFTLGIAFVLAAANVFYRDTQHIMQIVLQAWFFLTPIFYPITVLPKSQEILGLTVDIQLWSRRLNPMASLVASYQDILYHGVPTGLDFFLRTALQCFLIMVLGYLFFCHLSPRFGEEA